MTTHPSAVRLTQTTPPPSNNRAWARDFGIVGGATGFLAPFLVLRLFGYAVLTGLGGAVSGLLLGSLSAQLMARGARRWPKVSLLALGPLVGALWGALAGLATTLVPEYRDLSVLSVVVGAIAGSMQLGWFWLAYSVRRVNRRSTAGVVVAAVTIGAALGWAAALGVLNFPHVSLDGLTLGLSPTSG